MLLCQSFADVSHLCSGVPGTADRFLTLVEEVNTLRKRNPDVSPYVLVHCSAGIGRTGVLIMAIAMLEKLKRKVGHVWDVWRSCVSMYLCPYVSLCGEMSLCLFVGSQCVFLGFAGSQGDFD